jgi:hypothetical protein
MNKLFSHLLPILLIVAACCPGRVVAQGVSIGATAANASAALDIVSSSKGVLLPRMTQATRLAMGTAPNPAPAPGLIVFQTDGAAPGFYYNSGTAATPKWVRITDSDGVAYNAGSGLQVGPGTLGQTVQVGSASAAATDNFPFAAEYPDVRVVYLITAGELTAAGIRAGRINQVELFVRGKYSLQPFSNFQLRLALTTAPTVSAASFLSAAATGVSVANYATVQEWNVFQIPNLTWDGSSNLLLQVCYDNSTVGLSDNLSMRTGAANSAYGFAETDNATPGCGLTTPSAAAIMVPTDRLPVVRFSQSGAYSLPANTTAQAGQVLTMQGNGTTRFQDPTWTQVGNRLFATTVNSNLGIGTRFPAGRFHLVTETTGSTDDYLLDQYGPTGDQGFYFRRAFGTAVTPQDLPNGYAAGTLIGHLNFSARAGGATSYSGSRIAGYYRGNGLNIRTDLRFYTSGSGSERMRIDTTGRVGIATPNPLALLDLRGGADASGSGDPQMAFQYRNGGYRHWLRSRHNGNPAANGNALDFFLNNSNASAGSSAPTTGTLPALTLDNNGGNVRLGVGTTNPAGQLHFIHEGGGANDNYIFDGYGATGGHNLLLRRAGGTLAAPTILPDGSLDANASMLGNLTFVPRLGGGFGSSGSRIAGYYRGDGNSLFTDLRFYTSGNAERMRLTEFGSLGLGTGAPVSRLANTANNVIDSRGFGIQTSSITWEVNQQGYAAAFFNSNTLASGRGLSVKIAAADAASAAFDVSQGPTVNVAGLSLLRVQGDGNVGIGDNSPDFKLDVVGDLNADGTLRLNGAPMLYRSGNNLFVGTRNLAATAPTGFNNLFVGEGGGQSLTTGFNNNTLGLSAGAALTTGSNNVLVGMQAGRVLSSGSNNVLLGFSAGSNTVSGSGNLAMGANSLLNNNGNDNIGLGNGAGTNVITGLQNTFLGNSANLSSTTQHSRATALGFNAKVDQDDAVVLGDAANVNMRVGIGAVAPADRLHVLNGSARLERTGPALRLVSAGPGQHVYQEFYPEGTASGRKGWLGYGGNGDPNLTLRNDYGTTCSLTLGADGNLYVDGTFVSASDERLKQHIRPLGGSALSGVLGLRPVRYQYRPGHGPQTEQIGLLAQEVQQLFPELVTRNESTGYLGVNYAQLTPVLIQAIQELVAENQALKAQAAQARAETGRQQQAQASETADLARRLTALEDLLGTKAAAR